MAKIIQLIETDSTGHLVRLNDGHVVLLKHSDQGPPTVGSELNEDDFLFDHGKPMSIEQMNSDAQVAANVLSEIVKPTGPRNAADMEILAADRAADRAEDRAEEARYDRERG
jgi:hypothetical protein